MRSICVLHILATFSVWCVFHDFNTFTAIVYLSRFNNSCLKSPASTLVDLIFQLRVLRSFSLNQCCLFNSYVTFSKNNPNSSKSFLDFMSYHRKSDTRWMLYHRHHLTSRRARVEHLHLPHQNLPPKLTPPGS